jgi:hypothetical protein
MGLFEGIEKADIYANSKNAIPGDYLVRVDGLKTVESKRQRGVGFVIVELTVLGFRPGVFLSEKEGAGPSRPVEADYFKPGDTFAYKVKMSTESALSNVKAVVLEVYKAIAIAAGKDPAGVTEDQITNETTSALFAPNGSPAVGVKLHTTAFHIYKRDGDLFTKHTWSADLRTAPPEGATKAAAPATPAPALTPPVTAPAPAAPLAPATPPAFDRAACIAAIIAKNPAYAGMDFTPHADDVLKATLAAL